MSKYTYNRHFLANYAGRTITIPDQVAEDQRAWGQTEKSFPAINPDRHPWHGSKVRVRLNAWPYGLFTTGTSDCACRAKSGRNLLQKPENERQRMLNTRKGDHAENTDQR